MSTYRPGFVVPNAADTNTFYRQAEPDAVDWSVVANAKYGVLLGCNFAINAGSFTVNSATNIVVNNGAIQVIPQGSSISLNAASAADRFDLIGWNGTSLAVIPGTPVDDPVFPDLPDGFVLLAALYSPQAGGSYSDDNLVDKRVMLLHGVRGAAAADATFLRNALPTDAESYAYEVLGDGSTQWNGGLVSLAQSGDGLGLVLTGDSGLSISSTLSSHDITVTGSVAATETLEGSNLRRGAAAPNDNDGALGDIYQRTTGQLYVKRMGANAPTWAEVYADEYPPGTIIASILTGTAAENFMVGWYRCDGSTVLKDDVPRLADFLPESDETHVILPDFRGKFMMGAVANGPPGVTGGAASKILTVANLPAHNHFGSAGATTSSGGHTHVVSTSYQGEHSHGVSGGGHAHPVNDPGHYHNGLDQYGNGVATYFCGAAWGGQNKLDAIFSDASHTWTVDMAARTIRGFTDISIPVSGDHVHSIVSNGSHSHTVSISDSGQHTHMMPPETTVGSGTAVDITPPYYAVHYYIKA